VRITDVRIGDRAEVVTGPWSGIVGQIVPRRRPINPLASFAVLAFERAEVDRVWAAACDRMGAPRLAGSPWHAEEDGRIWITFDVAMLRSVADEWAGQIVEARSSTGSAGSCR
jgi:hypothetical protein